MIPRQPAIPLLPPQVQMQPLSRNAMAQGGMAREAAPVMEEKANVHLLLVRPARLPDGSRFVFPHAPRRWLLD